MKTESKEIKNFSTLSEHKQRILKRDPAENTMLHYEKEPSSPLRTLTNVVELAKNTIDLYNIITYLETQCSVA